MIEVEASLSQLIRDIVAGDLEAVRATLDRQPALAVEQSRVGASRSGNNQEFIYPDIAHYLYSGDTALHMASAAFSLPAVALLIERGASCSIRNRRGAEPLHYAADANHWAPDQQAATISHLLVSGADPDARDVSGVTPLHRAVRTRSAAAVRALLQGGALPSSRNRAGSTPLDLARHATGRSGSGTALAAGQLAEIVNLLLACGATPGRLG